VIEDLHELGLPLLSPTVVDEKIRGSKAASRDMMRRQQ
jgi:hypothetical protein